MATILAVDDSVSIRRLVSEALEAAGHTVVLAADAQEALSIAEKSRFDAVITDLNMPGMNGMELVQALRTLPGLRFVPILFLTTESSPEQKKRGKEVGATGWLVKPFDPDRLRQVVGQVTGTGTPS